MARLYIFAFDLGEASQIRRIRCLNALGHDLRIAGFRRPNMTAQVGIDTPCLDLGPVENNRFVRRMLSLVRAFGRFVRRGDRLAGADAIIARNFDLLLLAWALRMFHRQSSTPLVYECLDIHGIFTRPDMLGRLMRWAERRLLSRIGLLVVSSPGFIDHYFRPVQGYRGAVGLIENKLWFDGPPLPRPAQARAPRPDRPLTLGWVGSIRCAPSLALLTETARAMGDRLTIRIHGNVHRHALPDFDTRIAGLGNVSYAGEYSYPGDLAAIYAGCDLVWAQDLWQSGANSDWLLPNRIYEASWFGCPSVAIAGTETGRRIADAGLGLVIDRAEASALTRALGTLDSARLRAMSQSILDTDPAAFRLMPEDVGDALRPVIGPVRAARTRRNSP